MPTQGVMVRLMLVLAPVMCILSGIAVSHILASFMRNLDVMDTRGGKKKKDDGSYPHKNEIAVAMLCVMTVLLISYSFHCTWVSQTSSEFSLSYVTIT